MGWLPIVSPRFLAWANGKGKLKRSSGLLVLMWVCGKKTAGLAQTELGVSVGPLVGNLEQGLHGKWKA